VSIPVTHIPGFYRVRCVSRHHTPLLSNSFPRNAQMVSEETPVLYSDAKSPDSHAGCTHEFCCRYPVEVFMTNFRMVHLVRIWRFLSNLSRFVIHL
jgi:hypothetical protein